MELVLILPYPNSGGHWTYRFKLLLHWLCILKRADAMFCIRKAILRDELMYVVLILILPLVFVPHSELPPTSSSRQPSTFIVHLNSAKPVVQYARTISDAPSSTSSLRGRARRRFDSGSVQARAHAAFLRQRHRLVATAAGVSLRSIFHQ